MITPQDLGEISEKFESTDFLSVAFGLGRKPVNVKIAEAVAFAAEEETMKSTHGTGTVVAFALQMNLPSRTV